MKHKLLMFFLALIVGAGTVFAASTGGSYIEVDGVYYIFNSEDSSALVTWKGEYSKYFSDAYKGDIVIPERVLYEGVVYRVTGITHKAFRDNKYLTSMLIPNSVTSSIGEYAFQKCTGLTSVVIGDSVTSIERDAFAGCTALTSIIIPNSVTSIGERAFEGCTALTSVTIGKGVTSIGTYAFGDCTSLSLVICYAPTPPTCSYGFHKAAYFTLKVPEAYINAYTIAVGWKGSYSRILPLGISSIYVTIPTDVPDGYYEDMTLELQNFSSQSVQSQKVLNKRSIPFGRQIQGNEYQAFLKNAYGQVMGQTKKAKLGELDLTLTIDNVLRAKDVSLKVTIPDGTDVTAKVSVLWADSAGKAIGYTSRLKAVAEGAKLAYKVTLHSELASQYVAPDTVRYTVDGKGENILTLQLQPIQQLTLHGLVKDSESGEPISDASVALTQQLGGDNQSVTATTDDNGQYELQGTNVEGELSVTAPGYLPKTLEKVTPNGEGALPTVELEPFNGIIVNAWLTYTETVPQGAESKVADGYKGYSDIAYQVYNQTKDAAVENFIIKDNLLYFPSDVAIGDELRVTASSYSNNFCPVSAVCEIANSGLGYVTLPLVQKGCLKATVSTAESNSVMGVLYDANGRFVRTNNYKFAGLSFDGLASGDYSLVSMTYNQLLRKVLLQSTLSDMGLVEGTDYVKNAVHIEDGKIVTVNVPNVPALDEEKLHFTDSTTYFIADKNVINVGQYNIFSSRVSFEEKYAGRISNVEYMVDIPDEIELIANSALLGAKVCNYRIEDGHYIFPIENLDKNHLKFGMEPKAAGKFRVSGFVRFTLDGAKVIQPIGTIWVKANGFAIKKPLFFTPSILRVKGTAPTYTFGYMVKIYDYDKLVGSAKVGRDGEWATIVSLGATTNQHAFKAQMEVPGKGMIESEVRYAGFNKREVVARRCVMLDQQRKPLTFNFYEDTADPPSYTYIQTDFHSGYNIEFTFLAYFDDMDISEIGDVKIAVLTTDEGDVDILDAKYDDARKCYYATCYYGNYLRLPISAFGYYERKYTPMSDEELSTLTESKEKALAKVTHAAVNAAQHKGDIEVLPDDEETLNLKYTINGKDPLAFTMKEMDYDEASAYVFENGPLIYSGEAGNIVYSLVNGEEAAEMVMIDVDEHYALRTVISYAEIDDLGAGSSKRSARPKKIKPKAFLTGAVNLGDDMLALFGLNDYLNAPLQNDMMKVRKELLLDLTQKKINDIEKMAGETCIEGSFGKPRFTEEQLDEYDKQLDDLIDRTNQLLDQLDNAQDAFLQDLCIKAAFDLGTTVLSGGLAKGIITGAAKKLGPKAMAALAKGAALLETDNGQLTAASLGFAKDLLKSGVLGNTSLDQLLGMDFPRHYKEFQKLLDDKEKGIMDGYRDLQHDMITHKADCYDKEWFMRMLYASDEELERAFSKSARVLIDPSGYIYEAVPSNRVEGATAAIYYAVSEGQDALWDAENYDQVNPQITGADGMYQWDVPEGLWQVRVQKEGYENNMTDWLPVPPPQLDVNIPLVRNKLPGVKSAHAYEDAVTIRFDSYMLPDSLTTKLITVTENGAAVAGTITLTDEEAAPDGATYASQIRFVPTTPFTATQVTLFISGQVVNYAGIEMDEPYEAVLPIEKELKKLVADETVDVEYGSTAVLHVKGTPAAAAAGKTVSVKCASGIITSVAQSSVVLNADGEADVTVQGDLRGTDYVTFTIEDPELTASTTVKVVAKPEDFVVESPEASIPTDTEVERATSVTLSCQTEGATIYYTLDGSSPLDSDTRILYDGTPIVISTETTLTAIAVVDGKGESEVVVFHYTVKVGTQIANLGSCNGKVTPVRVHDSFEVTGLDGTFSLSVYSATGQLLMRHNQVTSGQKVNATALPTGLYLVEVNAGATYFTQRIIKD